MIILENVSYTYPNGSEAVKDVTLTIDRGEFVGIIGQSGAGKTTLAKLVIGLLKPTRGRVLVDGLDTRRTPVSILARKVGYVFQNPETMLFSATIREEMSFALRNLGVPPDEALQRINNALESVNLFKPFDHSPHTLSFGEKRRLAIACVLAMDTDFVVLDEPTTGLDYYRCVSLFKSLAELVEKGKTVMVITHDTDLLARYANRVITLEQGRVIYDGEARELLINVEFLRNHGFSPTHLQILAAKLKAKSPTVEDVAEALARVLSA